MFGKRKKIADGPVFGNDDAPAMLDTEKLTETANALPQTNVLEKLGVDANPKLPSFLTKGARRPAGKGTGELTSNAQDISALMAEMPINDEPALNLGINTEEPTAAGKITRQERPHTKAGSHTARTTKPGGGGVIPVMP